MQRKGEVKDAKMCNNCVTRIHMEIKKTKRISKDAKSNVAREMRARCLKTKQKILYPQS